MWKVYTIQNSMSLSKVLLEHSQAAFHAIRRDQWQAYKAKIFTIWLLTKKKSPNILPRTQHMLNKYLVNE